LVETTQPALLLSPPPAIFHRPAGGLGSPAHFSAAIRQGNRPKNFAKTVFAACHYAPLSANSVGRLNNHLN
jgi:hypothetical protein